VKKELKKVGAIAFASVLVLTGCTTAGSGSDYDAAAVTGDFDWKRFEGETVSVLLSVHPWSQGIEERISEFEDLTGVTVELQSYTEDLYFDKMEQAVRSQESPDVYMLPMDDTTVTQFAAGLIEPLTPYLDNPSLTSPDFDVEDIPRGLLDSSRFTADGVTSDYQIPIVTEAYILFYNKDLVDEFEAGQLPGSMADLISSAKKITAAGNGEVFGSVMRGTRTDTLRDTLTGVVLNQIPRDKQIEMPYNIWFDGAWDQPVLDDPNIVRGMTDYAELVAQGPSNRLNIDWPEATALFAQGKVAYFIDASTFGPTFEDPAQSTVAGKVGYAEIPIGEQDGSTATWSWGLNIADRASQKGAGWLFMQWATSKDMAAQLGALTGASPRLSSASDPIYIEALNPEFTQAVKGALDHSRTSTVQREGWKTGAFVIVDAMQAIVQGGDPETVLSEANDLMRTAVK
jgi:multiple sugar transport system substrate-binding protein